MAGSLSDAPRSKRHTPMGPIQKASEDSRMDDGQAKFDEIIAAEIRNLPLEPDGIPYGIFIVCVGGLGSCYLV